MQGRDTRVGLVLGAGGLVGQAFHAGVLAALEHDLGWDPRTADVIVGTSAGSVTGALLRHGVPAGDLAALAVEASLSEEAEELMAPLGFEPPEFPPLGLGDVLRPWRLPSPYLLARAARRPWSFRATVAAMTLMPAGRVDLTEHTEALAEVSDDELPPGLWINAARRSDGARTVFGRPGSPEATLGQAVAASCAIPGYFAPVTIDGISYIDGGVHSPTNADVLRDLDLDVVIVVSSMSAAGGRARTVDGAVRWWAHRRLHQELRRLRTAGIPVVAFEPRDASLRAMGMNAMATDRADRVVRAAFLETGRRTASPRAAKALSVLGGRAAERHAVLQPPAAS